MGGHGFFMWSVVCGEGWAGSSSAMHTLNLAWLCDKRTVLAATSGQAFSGWLWLTFSLQASLFSSPLLVIGDLGQPKFSQQQIFCWRQRQPCQRDMALALACLWRPTAGSAPLTYYQLAGNSSSLADGILSVHDLPW